MIERWKAAGCPMDDQVKHSMTPWARTIGGILKVNRFRNFLGNAGTRKTADDPVQAALAILGTATIRIKDDELVPSKPLRPAEWAKLIVDLGLVKTLLPLNERDTVKARTRATGVLLSKHLDEEFSGRTDTEALSFSLSGGNRRWTKGKNPHVRYVFEVLDTEKLPFEEGPLPDLNQNKAHT